MKEQGRSLGKQLAIWMPDLVQIAKDHPGHVWLMGRDMDVFYVALREMGLGVRYISGLNRENARKLARRGRLEKWLRSIGVKNGDVLIDSGYRGSIFRLIAEGTGLELYFLLLTADPAGSVGVPLNDSLNTEGNRRRILALEHSPKSEVIGWDSKKRCPKVTRLGGKEGQAASDFLRGCVQSLKEGVMVR